MSYSLGETSPPGLKQKKLQKVSQLAAQADLIIEVIDARIPISTADLLNYNDAALKGIPRIIYFSFKDIANPVWNQAWQNFYNQQNRFVVPDHFFDKHNIEDLIKLLQKEAIMPNDSHQQSHKPQTIVTIGAPRVGKKTLINKLKGLHHRIPNRSLLDKITHKNTLHQITDTIKVWDTIPVLKANLKELPQQILNLKILNKINIGETSIMALATQAFVSLFKYNFKSLNKAYNLNITPAQASKVLQPEVLNRYINMIAVNRGLNNEFNNIDGTQVFIKFHQDIKNNFIKNFSLEIPPQ